MLSIEKLNRIQNNLCGRILPRDEASPDILNNNIQGGNFYDKRKERRNYCGDEQPATIGEFGLTSRDSIYAKAKELNHTISQMRLRNENPEVQEKALQNRLLPQRITNTKDNLHALLINHTLKRKIELQRVCHKSTISKGAIFYGNNQKAWRHLSDKSVAGLR